MNKVFFVFGPMETEHGMFYAMSSDANDDTPEWSYCWTRESIAKTFASDTVIFEEDCE